MSERRKKYNPDLIALLAEEYETGVAMHELASRSHISSAMLKVLFREMGVACRGVKASINASKKHAKANISRQKLSISSRELFCKEYLSGNISVTNLDNKFNISSGVARKILKHQEGIFREPAYKSYQLDEDFFENIDTPAKAYWFGFVMADGCVFAGKTGGFGMSLTLQASDVAHLYEFRHVIGSTHPVKMHSAKCVWKGETSYKPQCTLKIHNAKFFSDLVAHGCIPNKTNTPTQITGLPKLLFPHFLRGYFDGDGSIVFHKRKNRYTKNACQTIECEFSCVGSESIMQYLWVSLTKHFDFNIQPPKQNRGCWIMRASGKHKISSIFEFMYSPLGPYLPRKFLKWQAGLREVSLQSY